MENGSDLYLQLLNSVPDLPRSFNQCSHLQWSFPQALLLHYTAESVPAAPDCSKELTPASFTIHTMENRSSNYDSDVEFPRTTH